MPKRFLAALAGVLCLAPTLALATTPGDWFDKAQSLHLAQDPYWRTLLRYEPGKSISGYVSRVKDQPRFFASKSGETSPEAELNATLGTWLAETNPAPNTSISCRFPARIAWLRERLGMSESDHTNASCPELEEWLKAINPQQATLIFASDYLNNPSSMFGHTLLRIDTPEQNEQTRLLAYTINYAAQTKESNGLLFAVNGLTGGYPGAFSVMPYYDKVKEYNDFENRDLWEYQLTLNPEEIRQLLRDLWELRGITFPYYFFSDNCSYELLGLFEAARPGLSLQKQFPVYAIPTDTVRVLLNQQGILKAVVYRPASATHLEHEVDRNTGKVNNAAKALIPHPQPAPAGLTPAEQAKAYETAYDYLYYRFLDHAATPEAPQQLRSLLVARSQVDAPDQRTPPPQPATDPSQGHKTRRFSINGGVDGARAFTDLTFRPAYHDLLDAPGGYRQGARIDFLDAGLRYEPDAQKLYIDHFTVLAIDSLAARDAFLKPTSWSLAMGQKREPLDATGHFSSQDRRSVAYFDGSAGISLSPADGALCYLQLKGDIEAGQALQNGWRTGIGPRLGCMGHTSQSQWLLELSSLYRNGPSAWDTVGTLGWQVQIDHDNALRLNANIEAENDQHRSGGSLAWMHYF